MEFKPIKFTVICVALITLFSIGFQIKITKNDIQTESKK